MEKSIIVWLSEEKICDMKMFSLVFAQGTYIGLICQSVNSIMHETVVKDPEKNSLWHLQENYQIMCIKSTWKSTGDNDYLNAKYYF